MANSRYISSSFSFRTLQLGEIVHGAVTLWLAFPMKSGFDVGNRHKQLPLGEIV